jgi:hypothetical protein
MSPTSNLLLSATVTGLKMLKTGFENPVFTTFTFRCNNVIEINILLFSIFLLDFVHPQGDIKPQRFGSWFYFHHQVKRTKTYSAATPVAASLCLGPRPGRTNFQNVPMDKIQKNNQRTVTSHLQNPTNFDKRDDFEMCYIISDNSQSMKRAAASVNRTLTG